ncbi:phosphate starvation-inducible protein PhoH [Kitasatospora sp. SolWspMP-SS2h]|uniref:PhoH family protein n=1 Tax=Kitasatospora sp. SolWspMP-SS2h TaxID=1305729 RepID=UPI000DBA25BD|nr:phosphate starvation-inducible protein PhoH [Kitasatospora sp. SolWspMP-SS2h]
MTDTPQTRTDGQRRPDEASTSTRIVIPEKHPMVTLLGAADSLLRVIEQGFPGADIHVRGNEVTATGAPAEVALVKQLFTEMMLVLRTGQPLTEDAVERSISMLRSAAEDPASPAPSEVFTANILSNRGRTIRPKTVNQQRYVEAIDKHTIVFGLGPAGTGKTYLAMAKAVQALQAKEVNRIILTRPAVEAGERLGFLPGTLYEKIDPYLRPLYDALHDMMDPDSIPRLMAAGTIEVAPLAYMRGRTLNDAFIILDEAQNTSPEQMKMFLTRLGFNSRVVVTGDTSQIDLPGGTRSGLKVVQEILVDVPDIHFSVLTSTDVVRHKLVGRIVDAYERWDARQEAEESGDRKPAQRRGARAPRQSHRTES